MDIKTQAPLGLNTIKTQYDYHKLNKNWLTWNDKSYSHPLHLSPELLKELGDKGYLKGKALDDYQKL